MVRLDEGHLFERFERPVFLSESRPNECQTGGKALVLPCQRFRLGASPGTHVGLRQPGVLRPAFEAAAHGWD